MKHRREAAGLVVLLAAMLAWAALAPGEKTLGDGIRVVYLHVAATWTALVGIYAAGLLGLLLALRPGETLERWLDAAGLTALTFFAAGFALSIAAAVINWGGVLWGEPRFIASIRVLAVGVGVWVVGRLFRSRRVKGTLWLLFAGYASYALRIADHIFHPDGAIQQTAYSPIQTAFYGISLLMLIAGLLVFRMYCTRSDPGDPETSSGPSGAV